MVGQLQQLHAEAVHPARRGGTGDPAQPGEGEPLPAGRVVNFGILPYGMFTGSKNGFSSFTGTTQ